MSRLMSVTEFVREHAPEMDVSTVRFYIKKYGIQPAELRDRCRGGWLYKGTSFTYLCWGREKLDLRKNKSKKSKRKKESKRGIGKRT